MIQPNGDSRRWLPGILVFLLLPAATLALQSPGQAPKPDRDTRLPQRWQDRGAFVMRNPHAAQRQAATVLEQEFPGVALAWDGMSGSPQWISASPGSALTAPSADEPQVIVRAFLRGWA